MDNSSDAVLIKQGHCSSEIVCRLAGSSSHFYDCVIKTISSDAESREEQDGGKHYYYYNCRTSQASINAMKNIQYTIS